MAECPNCRRLQEKLDRVVKLVEAVRLAQAKTYTVVDELRAELAEDETAGQAAKRLLGVFGAAWQAEYRSKYIFTFAKAMGQMKRLLKALPASKIEHRIKVYIASREPFYVNAKHSFDVFVAAINQLTDGVGSLQLPRPINCRHEPPCTDGAACTSRMMRELRA